MSAWPIAPVDDTEVDRLREQVVDLTRRCALLAAAAAPNPVDDGLIAATIIDALTPIIGRDLAVGCADAVRTELADAGLTIVLP